MIIKNVIYFNLIAIILTSCEADIKFIQATIRHGAKTPASSTFADYYYPDNPNKNRVWDPDKPWHLTNMGKNDAYDFGIYLKDRYPTLNQSFINFHAINLSRTLDTARLIATGFSSSKQQSWYPNLPLIELEVFVEPFTNDFMNYPIIYCENYNIDRNQAYNDTDRLFAVLSDIQDLYSYLSLHTGAKYTRSDRGWMLYQELSTQSKMGVTLEPWVAKVFPNGRLVDITAVEYIIQTYTTRMKRLTGGAWLKTLLDQVDELVVNSTTELQGHFYVSSELHIAAILNTLGVYKPHVPDYLSAILVELHDINGEYYIKIIYKQAEAIDDLIVPGCENSMCLLSTFKSVLNYVMMKNFDEDCGKRKFHPLYEGHNPE